MLKDWIEAMRPRTLPVSAAGVLTATGFAIWQGKFKLIPSILCFIFALLAQIVSNFANEYYDYKRGTDKKGRVGPKRGVTEGTISPVKMRNVTYATLALACIIGSALIPYAGWWLIIAGVFIAIFAVAYSTGPYPLSYHGLGDIAVLVFFGLVPVNLTYYLQAGQWNLNVFLASVSIGLLAVNVLLVNNYRDMEDDKEAGKNTTVVIFGRKAASTLYLFNGYIAMALLAPVSLLQLTVLNFITLIIYLVLHTITWYKLTSLKGTALNPILGATARNMLLFSLLFFIFMVLTPIIHL